MFAIVQSFMCGILHQNIYSFSCTDALNLIFPRNVGPDNRASFSCEGSESKLGLCTPILQQDLCSEQGDAGVNCSGNCLHIMMFNVISK